MGKFVNLKNETVEHIGTKKVLCIYIEQVMDKNKKRVFSLLTGYTKKEYEHFFSLLDMEYNSSYGMQEIYGFIWYKDGTWSSRAEYDGLEWWEHSSVPDYKKILKKRKE